MDKNTLYQRLREEFPFMAFEDFSLENFEGGIKIRYDFNLADRFSFSPELVIAPRDFYHFDIADKRLQNLAFHVGMVELISYWKAACPPKLIVRPLTLNAEQISWWKKLWFRGLGEFFYTNGITAGFDDFIEIIPVGNNHYQPFTFNFQPGAMVPLGGGKDSVVTLELLRQGEQAITPFILNPRGASLETAKTASFAENQVAVAYRTIHPQLLELNRQGFLNGHTPFSALLAFVTLIPAMISGTKHIALSNESSANEDTVAGTGVNHQYSKSFEFEKDFREYVAKFISPDFNYFSFLRPLNELQIGKIFSHQPAYFGVFKSCNVGSKTNIWCGHCPKCLFTWIILSPFLPKETLVNIFGKDLSEDASLTYYLDELTGIAPVKPFECVGTVDEVNAVLQHLSQKWNNNEWPVMLRHYLVHSEIVKQQFPALENILNHFNDENFLLPEFVNILKTALK